MKLNSKFRGLPGLIILVILMLPSAFFLYAYKLLAGMAITTYSAPSCILLLVAFVQAFAAAAASRPTNGGGGACRE